MARRCALILALAAAGVGVAGAGPPSVEWHRLSSADRRLVEPVVATSQIARAVDNILYPTRREIWEYLLDHPDFAADVARVLREGKYRIRPAGDHFAAADGRGVTGVMRPLYSANGRRIFYLEGQFDSKWLPAINGRAVLVLDSRYVEAPGRTPLADVAITGYLRIDNRFIGALIAIARDFSARTFDRRVRRFFDHVERLNRHAVEDPQGLIELLAAQPGLDQQRLREFRRILLGAPA
jgi:hypothetical protein